MRATCIHIFVALLYPLDEKVRACFLALLQVSLEERTKFKEETYSNVDGRRRVRSVEIKESWGESHPDTAVATCAG